MHQSFKRSFDALEQLFDFTEGFFESENVDREYLFAVNLAVEELFTNMVKYNPHGATDIEIRLDCNADRIEVVLTDHDAEDFDPTKAESAPVDKPIDERQPGKLGLFLVKKMMDQVNYHYENRQSTITLTKNLG